MSRIAQEAHVDRMPKLRVAALDPGILDWPTMIKIIKRLIDEVGEPRCTSRGGANEKRHGLERTMNSFYSLSVELDQLLVRSGFVFACLLNWRGGVHAAVPSVRVTKTYHTT